ncbi:MAG: hypothetical protein C4527_05345 [Candidatus Omnitrophota bacterium]|jgi:hypothetical protein|nr:MAG: hypothetical protein C4527_05345 [Candidatus Omnitrophota bacterium]
MEESRQAGWTVYSLFKPIKAAWHLIRHPKRTVSNVVSGVAAVWGLLIRLIRWTLQETAFWFHLFRYTSRQFLRVEAYLSVLGAFAFFGTIILQDMSAHPRVMLEYCYIYFTIVMVLLAMNLLPRERERDTLEILWSQPMTRARLIVMQLITLSVWVFFLCLLVIVFFRRFTAYTEGSLMILLFVITSSLAVGAITVLISTFCRHAIATGLVSLLVMGIHFFWLRKLGPIEIYYNPISIGQVWNQNLNLFDILFDRICLFVLIGFILDYLFRRLKQTAKWFT